MYPRDYPRKGLAASWRRKRIPTRRPSWSSVRVNSNPKQSFNVFGVVLVLFLTREPAAGRHTRSYGYRLKTWCIRRRYVWFFFRFGRNYIKATARDDSSRTSIRIRCYCTQVHRNITVVVIRITCRVLATRRIFWFVSAITENSE